MIVAKIKSKLNGVNSLFDIKTTSTLINKFDIDINPQGQLSRLIGIDKLFAHIIKNIMVRRGTYPNFKIGTSVNTLTPIEKTDQLLRSEIIDTLSEYSKYQQQAEVQQTTNVIGWNIYRTQTPLEINSWTKLNKSSVTNNFFYDDKNLLANDIYYYNVIPIYQVNGKPVSDSPESSLNYIGITIPDTNALNAIISSNFIALPVYKAVTLYWYKSVLLQNEELLRGISRLKTWFTPGEPRNLNIYVQITNVEKTALDTNISVF